MKKIYLNVAVAYIAIIQAFSQSTVPNSTVYQTRKLKVDEINLVSSYYLQAGNHSAVTGGIGTEKLSDFANMLDISFIKAGKAARVHTINLALGVDSYSSASSDQIDPYTISSASKSDLRIYPSVNWLVKDYRQHRSLGAAISLSHEYDYQSLGGNINYSKFSADNNREFNLKLQAFLDTWKVIYPIELRTIRKSDGNQEPNPAASGNKPRDFYNASFSLTQVINTRLQLSFLLDLAYQVGQLGTLYQRVYFLNKTADVEHLPESRFKIPIGLRANYFLGDRWMLRSFYRYYSDDWGIQAHTLEIETPYKITPFISVSPFYRFYNQRGANYFAGYEQHQAAEKFYTSDYDLSGFSSHFEGLNLRFTSAQGLLGWHKLNTIELRYGHYNRSDGLNANIITTAIKLK